MPVKSIAVWLNLNPVMSRGTYPAPTRWRAEWIARGTGTVIYKSAPCDTTEQATERAMNYLKRETAAHLRDTTGKKPEPTASEKLMPDPAAEDPEKAERRSRGWPFSRACNSFAEADGAEEVLKELGYETVRICWGGAWLEVRGRPLK